MTRHCATAGGVGGEGVEHLAREWLVVVVADPELEQIAEDVQALGVAGRVRRKSQEALGCARAATGRGAGRR